MKNDTLNVSTMSTTGTFSQRDRKGGAYLTIIHGDGSSSQIAIQVSHTTGAGVFKTNIDHKSALLNITFDDGYIWSGTFDTLKKKLTPTPTTAVLTKKK